MAEVESQRRGSVRELAGSGGAVAATRVFDVVLSYFFYIALSRAVGVREVGALVLALTVTQTGECSLASDSTSPRSAGAPR